MVRLGKTWGNLMVDLRATNEKLRERAIRIVQQVTGASREASIDALRAADWEVKPAVLVVGRGLEVSEARHRLEADGRLRVALEEAG
jgi:N-acetylmuramic acid 6-phosphate etherase